MPLIQTMNLTQDDANTFKPDFEIIATQPSNKDVITDNLELSYKEEFLFISIDKSICFKLNDSVILRFSSVKSYKKFFQKLYDLNWDLEAYLEDNQISF